MNTITKYWIEKYNNILFSVPEDQPQESKIRRIKGPGGDEKHVNIIFVKAPAPAVADQQIVDIPNDGGRQTLVYVLLKKGQKCLKGIFPVTGQNTMHNFLRITAL